MSSNNLKEGARRTGDGSSVLGRRLAHAEACAERLVYESEVREGKDRFIEHLVDAKIFRWKKSFPFLGVVGEKGKWTITRLSDGW